MIGNDIVDLRIAAIQSNWRRKGWLQKIFTSSEQLLIKDAENPDQMVWKLWSMKEAAYKAHQRKFSLSRTYNPWDYVCTDTAVHIEDHQYNTITKHTKRYVYSIAYIRDTNFISKVYAHSSKSYKKTLLEYVADIMEVKNTGVSLGKSSTGIPIIHIHNVATDIPISLSSHGSFSAFTIDL